MIFGLCPTCKGEFRFIDVRHGIDRRCPDCTNGQVRAWPADDEAGVDKTVGQAE